MKHLRKFDSVSAMTTAISSSEITIVGMALDNNVPVVGRKSVTAPPAPVTPPNNEIWYTSTDNNVVTPMRSENFGNVTITSNTYSGNKGIIRFSGNLTVIGQQAFYGCLTLRTIALPETVTTIDSQAFYSTSLSSITIPDSVTTMGTSIFENGTSLSSVTIGSSVTSIGNYAFGYCSYLETITVKATTPPTLTSKAFFRAENITAIYVPSSSVDTYKSTTGWTGFSNVIQAIQ